MPYLIRDGRVQPVPPQRVPAVGRFIRGAARHTVAPDLDIAYILSHRLVLDQLELLTGTTTSRGIDLNGGKFEIDERQQRIEAWLQEKRPDLASMYRSALSLLKSSAPIEDERTRVAYICHAMRELMNRLPDALGIGGTQKQGPRSSTQIQELPRIAAKYPGLDLLQDAENVPVPQELAAFLAALIKTAGIEDGRAAANAAALLTDDGSTGHPAVREWRSLTRYFVRWAHLHGRQSDVSEIPSDTELKQHIGAVEELMEVVLAEFFDNLHSIQDLLAEANFIAAAGGNEV